MRALSFVIALGAIASCLAGPRPRPRPSYEAWDGYAPVAGAWSAPALGWGAGYPAGWGVGPAGIETTYAEEEEWDGWGGYSDVAVAGSHPYGFAGAVPYGAFIA